LIATPGDKYSYTTHGFILLSAVVQRAGKRKFADQVADRIVKPLGMKTLWPDYQWEAITHRAVGYRTFGPLTRRSTDTDVSWKLGGGGFISSIDDMALLAEGLINRRLISEASETAMWTPQSTSDGQTTKLGLGFFCQTVDGTLQVSHNGSQEKTKTRLVIYPRQRHGMVVMSNSENANPSQIVAAVYQALPNE
jgi:CubicO group peptidase (beta-lactamase class C family)